MQQLCVIRLIYVNFVNINNLLNLWLNSIIINVVRKCSLKIILS